MRIPATRYILGFATTLLLISGCSQYKFVPARSGLLAKDSAKPAAVLVLPGINAEQAKANDYGYVWTALSAQGPGLAGLLRLEDRGYLLNSNMDAVVGEVDFKGLKIRLVFEIPEVPGSLFVLHVGEPGKQPNVGLEMGFGASDDEGTSAPDKGRINLSRFDLSSGEFRWTAPAGVHGLWIHRQAHVMDSSVLDLLVSLRDPVDVRLAKDGKRLVIVGLVGSFMKPSRRFAIVDLDSGDVLEDEIYDCGRLIDADRELFIDMEKRLLVLKDLGAGKQLWEANYDEGEIVAKRSRTPPFRVDRRDGASPFLVDVNVRISSDNLLISSRNVWSMGFGNNYKTGPLLGFRLQSGERAEVFARPLRTAVDYSPVMAPDTNGPLVLPEFSEKSQTELVGLAVLETPGAAKTIEVGKVTLGDKDPAYPHLMIGEKERGRSWALLEDRLIVFNVPVRTAPLLP